nr:immunoglobulin light chain junction region [Macaca mulatta]MOV75103.1 immunoglobulin light chain junction region [Macaca mulatta]MOV75545.1 immunoglobulin light chain junction region [Macaca mulatta]MOV75693.1 immunoglobulin light chain junction region [Macaca mulatta]MOV75874.1 immunoglobulin light chain junction region [Macaca mulatta]
CQHTYGTPPTF